MIGQILCHTSLWGLALPLFKSTLLFFLLPPWYNRIFSNDHLSSLFGSIFSPLSDCWTALALAARPYCFRPTHLGVLLLLCIAARPRRSTTLCPKFLLMTVPSNSTCSLPPRNQTALHHEPPRRPAHLLPLLHPFGFRLSQQILPDMPL